MEEWKIIGEYEVSNEGRVKSVDRVIIRSNGRPHTVKGKLLSQHIDDRGYLRCGIGKIHKLVAEAFVPNPNNYTTVHHKDHNKLNNKADNLEWIDETVHNRSHGGQNPCKKTYQYTLNGELVCVYPSVNEASRVTGFCCSRIASCCRGELKHYKDYIWSYEPL